MKRKEERDNNVEKKGNGIVVSLKSTVARYSNGTKSMRTSKNKERDN